MIGRLTGFIAKNSGRLIIAGLALFTVCLYAPSVTSDFVYDARAQILVDDYVHDAGNLADVLTLRVLKCDVIDHRRPVQLLSLMMDAAVWGKKPAGFHMTNILLHALCVVLLFKLLVRLLENQAATWTDKPKLSAAVPAAFAALLFAVHPVQTETVCEVTYREDLLVTAFILIAFNLGVRLKAGKQAMAPLAAGVVALLFATGAKENGFVGAFLIGAYCVFSRRTGTDEGPIRWMVLTGAVLSLGFVMLILLLRPETSAVFTTLPTYPGGSFRKMLAIQPRIWTFQLFSVLWPTRLCADYGPESIRRISPAFAVTILIVVWTLLLVGVRRSALGRFALVAYWLLLAPVSNLVPLYRPFADRYLYLPMTAVAMLVADSLYRAGRQDARAAKLACLAALIVVAGPFVAVNLDRQAVWKNETALWKNTRSRNIQSVTASNNLGFALFRDGDSLGAVSAWEDTVALTKGKHADTLAGLALGLWTSGRRDEAMAAYRSAVALDPRYEDAKALRRSLFWEKPFIETLMIVRAYAGGVQ